MFDLKDLIESSLHRLPGESYSGESCFGGILLTPQGIIPLGDWFCGVWYPGEIDSPGYDNPGRLTLRSMNMIPRAFWHCAVRYPGRFKKIRITQRIPNPNKKKISHWSVTQAGSNYEKAGGRKSRCTVPLHMGWICSLVRTPFSLFSPTLAITFRILSALFELLRSLVRYPFLLLLINFI